MVKCEFPAFGYYSVETCRTSKSNFQSEINKRREDENNKEERPFFCSDVFQTSPFIWLQEASGPFSTLPSIHMLFYFAPVWVTFKFFFPLWGSLICFSKEQNRFLFFSPVAHSFQGEAEVVSIVSAATEMDCDSYRKRNPIYAHGLKHVTPKVQSFTPFSHRNRPSGCKIWKRAVTKCLPGVDQRLSALLVITGTQADGLQRPFWPLRQAAPTARSQQGEHYPNVCFNNNVKNLTS